MAAGVTVARIGASAFIKAVAASFGTTETWTGTTGAAWPSQWTISQVGGTNGSTTIQSNVGRMTSPSAAFSSIRAYLNGLTAQTDMNAVVTFTQLAQTTSYLSIAISDGGVAQSDGNYSTNGIIGLITFSTTATASAITLWKSVGSTNTQLGSSVTKTITANTAYKARVQRISGTVRMRMWAAASAEPSTWDISVADNTVPAGKAGLFYENGNTTTAMSINVDDYTLTAS